MRFSWAYLAWHYVRFPWTRTWTLQHHCLDFYKTGFILFPRARLTQHHADFHMLPATILKGAVRDTFHVSTLKVSRCSIARLYHRRTPHDGETLTTPPWHNSLILLSMTSSPGPNGTSWSNNWICSVPLGLRCDTGLYFYINKANINQIVEEFRKYLKAMTVWWKRATQHTAKLGNMTLLESCRRQFVKDLVN